MQGDIPDALLGMTVARTRDEKVEAPAYDTEDKGVAEHKECHPHPKPHIVRGRWSPVSGNSLQHSRGCYKGLRGRRYTASEAMSDSRLGSEHRSIKAFESRA